MLRQMAISFLFVLLFINNGICSAASEENIISFDSHIKVNTDGSIDVTENISVYANGNVIKRGIVRELPTQYVDSYGIQRYITYRIQQILLNGTSSDYHTETGSNKKNIYIGDKNTFLTPGAYTYTISYHVNNAVNFLNDVDEIYWNITGNNWIFPILSATALIDLPSGAVISLASAYTGNKGENGKNYVQDKLAANQIQFTTTVPLTQGQGLTIAVAWQKGIVTQPGFWQLNQTDYRVLIMVVLVLFYYIFIWFLEGRDLRNRAIIPLFKPPADLSPEAMRYIINMSVDHKTYSCAIISMAAKGYMKIENKNKEINLVKNNEFSGSLSPEESVIADKLFTQDAIKLTQENARQLSDAKSCFLTVMKNLYKENYFVTNSKYVWYGILLSIAACAVPLLSTNMDAEGIATYLMFIVYMFTFQIFWIFLILALFTFIKNIFTKPKKLKSLVFAVLSLFAVIIMSGIEAGSLEFFQEVISLFSIICLGIIPFIIIIFVKLMKAPTSAGRMVMDQIDGFRMYLKTAESYRLKNAVLPEKTPQLFEKYLPYAIALDVENEWGAQFESVLRQAGINPANYHPSWYVSSEQFNNQSLSTLTSSISDSLTTTITSSTSASGGGGTSGGGGGGGGGGGW